MRKSLAVLAILIFSGCYHATVTTGLAPAANAPHIERGWAHGWLWGLVPPSATETTQQCPRGVATVETKVSVANRLASWFTGGLYTPMSVTATCASE